MQDDLFARPAAPPPSLFFALLPSEGDQAVLDEALRLHADRFGPSRPIAAAKRHVTLLYLGQPLDEQIPSLVQGAQRALETLVCDPFVLTLDQVGVFGRNALVLAASQTPPALAQLDARLREAALRQRLQRVKAPVLHPHLTLAHNDGRRAPVEACAPVRLAFDAFVLLRGGVPDAYQELGRWSLG
ncbi:2'-5' RNA ligase family protein [Pseudoxanthomonas sp. JBR18]|uniref:2'-5' RNA ligase family protein n=1 Tax=Pseudoxanthomonas sp. JBR18 TaxID=2969308 RepID=UPI00230674B5|nr:2'-5' RNA ligase family protein [Pseudoxanthomonas sp. JBR18]WCE03409.1 2'-5' RNA ligase family protein [Pseudoxanthomonas sp. JBR18]